MKRNLIYVCALAFYFLGAPAQAALQPDAQFFVSLQDVPLMAGMAELPDQTVVFDKPEGRIVESVAALQSIPQNEIRTYYESTLPQLGWQKVADDAFVRKDEIMKLHFETYEGANYLRIMVAPNKGSEQPAP